VHGAELEHPNDIVVEPEALLNKEHCLGLSSLIGCAIIAVAGGSKSNRSMPATLSSTHLATAFPCLIGRLTIQKNGTLPA
jgi:hypothetical protein